MTVSVGLVISTLPRLPAGLLDAADMTLYQAEETGPNNVQVASPGLDDAQPVAGLDHAPTSVTLP